MPQIQVLKAATAAGTALTASSSETVLERHTLPALHAQVGRVYRLHATVRATATNSTDTLVTRFRVGSTTLTGTVIGTNTAADAANDDVIVFDLTGVVRTAGASGTVGWSGWVSNVAAEGTGTSRVAFEVDTMDTTVDQFFEITGTWSTTSAGNSCQSESYLLTAI